MHFETAVKLLSPLFTSNTLCLLALLVPNTLDSFSHHDPRRSRTLIVFSNANPTLRTQAMSPEATEFNVRLWHPRLGDEQPATENRFGQHVKDGIGDNFAIDAENTGAFGYAPDTR